MTRQEKWNHYVSLHMYTGRTTTDIERQLNLTKDEKFEFLARFEKEYEI